MTDRKKIRIAILGKFDSQADFSQAVGMHESAVSQVMRGRRKLGPNDAVQWVKTLKCDPGILRPVIRQ